MTAVAQAEKVMSRCRKLAGYSEDRDGIRRTFLSPPMRDCHREITEWLLALRVPTWVDAVGNLHGLYPGATPDAHRLLIGSHLDTVPNAGAFDGVLGVVLAVALLEGLEGKRLPFAIEVLGFSEEEGVRFGIPFIGSRALVGRMDDDLLDREDSNGLSVRKAIENFGLNVTEIDQARVRDGVLGYLEFHIEQGPVLEELGLPLAVVETIAGQSRLEFLFVGNANHAGTTPMPLRHDALTGAAEWVSAVERSALAQPGLVATVGAIDAKPGVSNAIAGQTRVSLDVRHASDRLRQTTVKELVRQAGEIARKRGLLVEHKILLDQKAVTMDSLLIEKIAAAMHKTGVEVRSTVSGAGHDAMILAELVPSAMIFLRTPKGLSHHPEETVLQEDVGKAIECGLQLLSELAASTEFVTRTCGA